MLLENETPFAARLLQVDRGENLIQGMVVVKATFEWNRAGEAVPAAEQVPIVGGQLQTAFGIFHTDCFIRKLGVDLCLLGTLRRSRPERNAVVRISVGAYQHELALFGDRRWVRLGSRLVASDPSPFVEMPLTYALAYGGTTQHDYEDATFADNPIGRGYYLSEAKAEGQLLPNIESNEGPLIQHWSDQARPAGVAPYPMFWGLRAREGVEVLEKKADEVAIGEPFKVTPRLNNHAHPALVLASFDERDSIRISGLRDSEIELRIPSFAPELEVRVGSSSTRARGELDGIFIWADAGHVTLTRRIHFEYPLRKAEVRSARLIDTVHSGGS